MYEVIGVVRHVTFPLQMFMTTKQFCRHFIMTKIYKLLIFKYIRYVPREKNQFPYNTLGLSIYHIYIQYIVFMSL